jgi:hypothetical protein
MSGEAHKKVVARNVTLGPKVLNASPAIVLQAGESTEASVLISDAELEMAKLSEWFEISQPSVKEKAVK